MELNRKQVNELMGKAIKQGYIFVVDVAHKVVKVYLNEWDKKRRCIFVPTNGFFDIPIYAKNYGKKHKNDFWVWALTKEELENK